MLVKNYELLNKTVYLNCGEYTFEMEEPYLIASSQDEVIAGSIEDFLTKDGVVEINIDDINGGLKKIDLEFENISTLNYFESILRNKLNKRKEAIHKAQKYVEETI